MASENNFGVVIIGVAVLAAGFWLYDELRQLSRERTQLAEAEASLASLRGEPAAPPLAPAPARPPSDGAVPVGAALRGEAPAPSLPPAQAVPAIVGVMDALMAATQAKAAVADAYQTNGTWPRSNREAGLPAPEDYRNERIYSLYVQPGGQIRVVLARDGRPAESLVLQGSVNPAGLFSWRCSSPDMANLGQLVPACR